MPVLSSRVGWENQALRVRLVVSEPQVDHRCTTSDSSDSAPQEFNANYNSRCIGGLSLVALSWRRGFDHTEPPDVVASGVRTSE